MATTAPRTALVTGAAGFVGANLVRRLAGDGLAVVGMTRSGGLPWRLQDVAGDVRMARVDLLDHAAVSALVADVRPDWVFHLATSRAVEDAERLRATNVVALGVLLDAVARLDACRLVNAGSSLEYGATDTPYDEAVHPQPTSPFGASKAAATALVAQRATAGDVCAVTLRLFHVYGPWEAGARFVPRAIRAVLSGGELPLTRPGLRHDFVFVADVIDAFVAAAGGADLGGGTAINVCTGQQSTNEEIVDLLENLTGGRAARRVGQFPARAWDRESWTGTTELAERLLGWHARHSLRDGLERTMSWLAAR